MNGRSPRVYGTECIVLSRRNLGEADTIFTVFSPEFGRFDAIARGIRKTRSHMRGHIEPLIRCRVLLARGRTLDVFTQAETLQAYRAVHENLERCAAALYAAELVRRFAPERQSLPDLYGLLVDFLALLEHGARLSVLRAFEVHLLRDAGMAPQVEHCAGCQGRLPEQDTFFAPDAGGALCAACRPGGGPGRLVSSRAIKVLRYAGRVSLAEFSAIRIDGALEGETEAVLGDAIRQALDAEPRSGRFLHEVRALYPVSPDSPPGSVESSDTDRIEQ